MAQFWTRALMTRGLIFGSTETELGNIFLVSFLWVFVISSLSAVILSKAGYKKFKAIYKLCIPLYRSIQNQEFNIDMTGVEVSS